MRILVPQGASLDTRPHPVRVNAPGGAAKGHNNNTSQAREQRDPQHLSSGGGRGLGDLSSRAVRARQLRKFCVPGVRAGVLGEALEQQGEHRERHAGVNAMGHQ